MCYDNIFTNAKFEEHPRYMEHNSPFNEPQVFIPDLEDIDDIFNPEEGQDDMNVTILTPTKNSGENALNQLKDSSVKITKGNKSKHAKEKLVLKKEDEMLLTVSDIRKYLQERRSKAKTGIREDHQTYIQESQ